MIEAEEVIEVEEVDEVAVETAADPTMGLQKTHGQLS